MLVVLAIFMTNMIAIQLQYVVSGKIDLMILMELFFVQSIVFINFLTPLGGFVAALSVLGRLYTSNELIVMRSCGMSRVTLFAVLMLFGFGLTCFSIGLSFWLSPIVEGQQSLIMSKAERSVVTRKIMPKRFNVIGQAKQKVVYVAENDRQKNTLQQVFIALPAKQGRTTLPLANWDVLAGKSMSIKNLKGRGSPFIVLNQGHRYHFNAKQDLIASDFAVHGMLISALKLAAPPWPQSADIQTLWRHSFGKDSVATGELLLRLAVPISVFILLIIAFGLTKIAIRRARLNFVFPAIILFAFYSNSIFMMQSWVAKNKIGFLAAQLWLHGLPLLLGLLLIFCRHGGWDWFVKMVKR